MISTVIIKMFSNIETIIDNFLHPKLKRIKGKPNREDLIKVKNQIYENLASYITKLEGHNHGYLGLAMPVDKYTELTGTTFEHLDNTRLTPDIPNGATQHLILAIQHEHTANLKQYN